MKISIADLLPEPRMTVNFDPRPAATPEPAPVPNDKPALWDLVIEDMKEMPVAVSVIPVIADMRARDAFGRAKYGTPLQAGNGRDALVDAYQEALDLVVYLKQVIVEKYDGRVWAYYRDGLNMVDRTGQPDLGACPMNARRPFGRHRTVERPGRQAMNDRAMEEHYLAERQLYLDRIAELEARLEAVRGARDALYRENVDLLQKIREAGL